MKTLVIIPTFNEKKNIFVMYKKLQKIKIKFDVLFVDDKSEDGSQEIIKKLAKKNKKIKYIFRPKKMGVGSAHKDGFVWAYKRKYGIIVTLDADGTHDPKYIKQMIKKLKHHSMIITNRFIKKNSMKDWPFFRILITYLRHIAVSLLLSIKYDSSGAFRCIDCKKIPLSDLILAKDSGYSYFWESIFILHTKKHKISEIAMPLPFRKIGSSNIAFNDILFAVCYLFVVFLKRIFKKY